MAQKDPINSLVLQEFRLHAADSEGDAARIVAGFTAGIEAAVPLLTSIDDPRDVAIVRALHAGEQAGADTEQRAALDSLVATWEPIRRYGPRIAEHSRRSPKHYRLAVTESGINTPEAKPVVAGPSRPSGPDEEGGFTSIALLWIGAPLDTFAGLLTLLGSDEVARPDAREWPLPLSRSLGVRIYESLS
jgi:hypothetical protein